MGETTSSTSNRVPFKPIALRSERSTCLAADSAAAVHEARSRGASCTKTQSHIPSIPGVAAVLPSQSSQSTFDRVTLWPWSAAAGGFWMKSSLAMPCTGTRIRPASRLGPRRGTSAQLRRRAPAALPGQHPRVGDDIARDASSSASRRPPRTRSPNLVKQARAARVVAR